MKRCGAGTVRLAHCLITLDLRLCRRAAATLLGDAMTTEAASAIPAREPALLGQTVVVLGGSAGIGLETARRASGEGADVFLTGRNPERLAQAARDVGARRSAAFDANDAAAVKRFFDDLPGPIDHVLVAAYPWINHERTLATELSD